VKLVPDQIEMIVGPPGAGKTSQMSELISNGVFGMCLDTLSHDDLSPKCDSVCRRDTGMQERPPTPLRRCVFR